MTAALPLPAPGPWDFGPESWATVGSRRDSGGYADDAIRAAVREALGADAGTPVTKVRYPVKGLRFPRGEYRTRYPEDVLRWQSLAHLHVAGEGMGSAKNGQGSHIILEGDVPPVRIDGVFGGSCGRFSITGESKGGRFPSALYQVYKDIQDNTVGAPQTRFVSYDLEFGGDHRTACRLGTDGWAVNQQDHNWLVRPQCNGQFDVDAPQVAGGRWQEGIVFGYPNWGNSRIHHCSEPFVRGYARAFTGHMTGVQIDHPAVHNCRDIFVVNGTVESFDVFGGKSEYCQRLLLQILASGHVHPVNLTCFNAKLDGYPRDPKTGHARPFGGPALGEPPGFANCWAYVSEGGDVVLDRCSIMGLPSYHAPSAHNPALRTWDQPHVRVYARNCVVQGYAPAQAFRPSVNAQVRHEGYRVALADRVSATPLEAGTIVGRP